MTKPFPVRSRLTKVAVGAAAMLLSVALHAQQLTFSIPAGDLKADLDTNPQLARFLLDLRAGLSSQEGWQPFRRMGRPVQR